MATTEIIVISTLLHQLPGETDKSDGDTDRETDSAIVKQIEMKTYEDKDRETGRDGGRETK